MVSKRPVVDPYTDSMDQQITEYATRNGYTKPKAHSVLLQTALRIAEADQ